ncbi:hypothetical protein CALVIDRAFT_536019 [Calocera viscosa TUFC12733]|uniref:Uncharacterized protein n=1 Tax=Calocera viscosa (strain TUFC12733) TaxID=1330018 RepID=A0A167NP51_CALVF|nr:hypothetical protein CALVIDRAFT_536019 [Calocera viscosa TUFC12733]
MALSKPHPQAQAKQERMLAELDQLGFNLPGTPGTSTHRRHRSHPANIAASAAGDNGLGTPFLSPNPYNAWPWGYLPSPSPYGYASPGLHPTSPYGWAAYPPHPYSPQRSPYRLSPSLPQQELYTYQRRSPRQQIGHSDDAWDYRDYEDIR